LIKPWFLTEGKTCCYIHHTFLLGFPNWPVIYFITTVPSIAIKTFSGAVAGEEKRRLLQGEFHTHILYFVLVLLYFYLHRFIKNTKNLVSFIVVISLLLVHYVVP
jgi:hypothetical protein